MSGRARLFILAAIILLHVYAFSSPTVFTEDLGTELYDCTLTLAPSSKLSESSTIQLMLEKKGNDYTAVTFSKQAAYVAQFSNGKKTIIADKSFPPGTIFPARISILRRSDRFRIYCNDLPLIQVKVVRKQGATGAMSVGKGWGDPGISLQRLEPVFFADNFMRSGDEQGAWKYNPAAWGLQSAWDRDPKGSAQKFKNAEFALNPFAWVGKAPGKAELCTAGHPLWDDYNFSASVRPAANGAVGLAVNMSDGKNGYLVRWTPVNAEAATGANRLTLCKLINGKLKIVAEKAGGYLPGQWYKMSVISTLNGLKISIDNQERLSIDNPFPRRGGVGLYVEGRNGATFDDITVYGSTLKKELIDESVLARLNEKFLEDFKGMDQWSNPSMDWLKFPGNPAFKLYRWDCYGDNWMSLTAKRRGAGNGEITLALNSNGVYWASGYRAVISVGTDKEKTGYAIYRGNAQIATWQGDALEDGVDYEFRFRRTGNSLKLEKDSHTVLNVEDKNPLKGRKSAYRISGSFYSPSPPLVLGRNVIDETFAEAPVNWIGDGEWMATTRWACSSQWSFYAGWSRGNAILWNKRRFTGDHSFEAFIAPKMEYPREHQFYSERFRDMAITICSDGKDPLTGYTGIYGYPDKNGYGNNSCVLMRNGQVVGRSSAEKLNWIEGHTEWFDLVLRKKGNLVEFLLGNRLLASFTDPEPISGGVPAIWTTDNGICISRIRLFYENQPVPRNDPQVVIDHPWYPEWANIGETLTFDFTETMSTTGKPVSLTVSSPATLFVDENAAKTEKGVVKFTPTALGEHWYQVTATDGANTSHKVDISLPVFKPALGRDDSHALVLYRFDEGVGNIVNDHGSGEPADLTIDDTYEKSNFEFPGGGQLRLINKVTQNTQYEWLPTHGLHLTGPNRLITKGAASKLMAIARANACTMEFWISPDTVFPLSEWLGVIMTWELPGEKRNFGFSNIAYYWSFSPYGTFFGARDGRTLSVDGARNGLHHLALTWDGKMTTLFMDGRNMGQSRGSWQPEKWYVDAPLVLGNQPEGKARNYFWEANGITQAREDIILRPDVGQHCFLGAFFLAAIHDRCFSREEIQRHYLAGPSAR